MSNPEEFENSIKEKRLLEANKKGLIGKNGKIGTILKNLGQPIIDQKEGGIYIDTNYLDLYEIENDENLKIPTMAMEETQRPNSAEWSQEEENIIYSSTNEIGLYYEGLSRGMHLEIKYDDFSSELILYYKGYCVYRETKGELLSYCPGDWEVLIEKLYKEAKEKQRINKEKEFEESIKENEKDKKIWWEKLKKTWGI